MRLGDSRIAPKHTHLQCRWRSCSSVCHMWISFWRVKTVTSIARDHVRTELGNTHALCDVYGTMILYVIKETRTQNRNRMRHKLIIVHSRTTTIDGILIRSSVSTQFIMKIMMRVLCTINILIRVMDSCYTMHVDERADRCAFHSIACRRLHCVCAFMLEIVFFRMHALSADSSILVALLCCFWEGRTNLLQFRDQ